MSDEEPRHSVPVGQEKARMFTEGTDAFGFESPVGLEKTRKSVVVSEYKCTFCKKFLF